MRPSKADSVCQRESFEGSQVVQCPGGVAFPVGYKKWLRAQEIAEVNYLCCSQFVSPFKQKDTMSLRQSLLSAGFTATNPFRPRRRRASFVLRPCVYLIDGGGAKLDAQGSSKGDARRAR